MVADEAVVMSSCGNSVLGEVLDGVVDDVEILARGSDGLTYVMDVVAPSRNVFGVMKEPYPRHRTVLEVFHGSEVSRGELAIEDLDVMDLTTAVVVFGADDRTPAVVEESQTVESPVGAPRKCTDRSVGSPSSSALIFT